MARHSETYRSERRNYARRRKLVWRILPRERTGEGTLFVVVPDLTRLYALGKAKGGVR